MKSARINLSTTVKQMVALIVYLKRGRRTINEIRDEMDVNRVTVYRRVRALKEAGVPVQDDYIPGDRGEMVMWINREWRL